MSLRIRQVKPDFWRDSTVAVMADSTRLAYIGMWMEADDAGWFRLDVTGIAADLYPYLARQTRERRLLTALAELEKAERIEKFECGHALVRNLTRHQRFAALDKRFLGVFREHEGCPVPPTAGNRGKPRAGSKPVTGLFHAQEEAKVAKNRGLPQETAVNRGPSTTERKGGEGKGKERGGAGGSPAGSLFEIKDGRLTKTTGAA